jgi:hypothetical protein
MNDEVSAALRQQLRSIAATATDAQREFMESLASREREPKNRETNVTELESCGESRQAAIKFFKELANSGCGQFKAGRRQKPSRFVWDVKAKTVGRVFLDLASGDPQHDETFYPAGDDHEAKGSQFHAHVFLLRPRTQVTLELPLDLTVEESIRLAEFVRALPFHQNPPSETNS